MISDHERRLTRMKHVWNETNLNLRTDWQLFLLSLRLGQNLLLSSITCTVMPSCSCYTLPVIYCYLLSAPFIYRLVPERLDFAAKIVYRKLVMTTKDLRALVELVEGRERRSGRVGGERKAGAWEEKQDNLHLLPTRRSN